MFGIQRVRPSSLAMAFILTLFASISGCGGGGDGSSTPSSTAGISGSTTNTNTTTGSTTPPAPPAPPAAPVLAVSIVPAPISIQADTSQLQSSTTVQIAIANPPTGTWYYRASWAGSALQSATSNLSSTTEGTLTLTPYSPRSLGAGTYTSTVTFTLCADSQCNQLVANGSVTVPVTYVVTGSATPLTQVALIPTSNNRFQTQSIATAGPIVTYALNVADLPPAGLRLLFSEQPAGGGTRVISGIDFKQTSNQTADLKVQFATPTGLPLGSFPTNLVVRFCFDAACTREVSGSPITLPMTLDVYGSEGRDFTRMTLSRNVADAAWDPVSSRIYAVTTTTGGGNLIAVDPVSGSIGPSTTLPSQPAQISLSDDGRFAYVRYSYSAVIQRYRLPGLQPDLAIPLDAVPYKISVAPGSAHTLAVSFDRSDYPIRLAIYDDATPRANTIPRPFGASGYPIAWGTDSSVLFGMISTVARFSVTPSGVTALSDSPLIGQGLYSVYAAGRIYFPDGHIFDTTTNRVDTPAGLDCCGSAVAVRPNTSRAYYLNLGYTPITVVDTQRLQSIASIGIPGSITNGFVIFTWGSDGLAYVTYDGDLVSVTGTFMRL